MLLYLLYAGQSLEFGPVGLFARHAAAPPLLVLAFEWLPEFGRQRLQDRALIRRRAGAAAAGEGGRRSALRVGGLEELAHEAEPGLADVGAASEHVEDGVDSAAEVGKGRDIGTGFLSGLNHGTTVLQ